MGSRGQSLWLRVHGHRFRVWGLGCRMSPVGFNLRFWVKVEDLGFQIYTSGFRFRVQGLGGRGEGSGAEGSGVEGSRCEGFGFHS